MFYIPVRSRPGPRMMGGDEVNILGRVIGRNAGRNAEGHYCEAGDKTSSVMVLAWNSPSVLCQPTPERCWP